MTAPTPEDLARDLLADLALCDAASPGPWLHDERIRCAAIYQGIETVDCFDDVGRFVVFRSQAHDDESRGDFAFIAAAREALPTAIRRALSAEARLARVEEVLRSVTRDYPTAAHLVVSVIRERLAKEAQHGR